tara:strand:+ start:6692 stop:7543 length:852 start_codon:yes stop_codon:yes gene_type:complete
MANEMGATEVSAVQGSLVSQLVQQALREKAVAFSTITDYGLQEGLSQLKIPRVNNFTAAAKSENTDLSNQEMTVSADTISYNKHFGVRATIEDAARLSAGIDVSAEVIKGQADELARQIDADIIFQIKSVSSSTPDHLLDYTDSSGDALAIADIANARKLLRNQNVPMDDGKLFMLISPDSEADLLNISNFVKANEYGDSSALVNGFIGKILGFNVVVSSQLDAQDACFYHSSHVGFSFAQPPKLEQDRRAESLGDMFVTSALYGTSVLDGGKRGVLYNGSGS